MARMLGERIFPESVTKRRRSFRNRVRDLREPVRRFREQNVPGPDMVGKLESSFVDLRDRFVERDSVLSGISARRRGTGGSDGSGEVSSSDSDSGNGVPAEQRMT